MLLSNLSKSVARFIKFTAETYVNLRAESLSIFLDKSGRGK